MKERMYGILLILLTSITFAEQRLPKGEIADPVPSAYDPGQSHAIYLPSAYTPEKKWPILFCYEARGRGRIPVELFREAAERLGWIIFSSNNSRSDDPSFNNLEVLNSMWSDSHQWFSLDERRIYATGFSGGARLAWGMGYVYPTSTAGVIGVGAGAHYERSPTKDTPFVWYGISGNQDFNYLELRKLEDQLSSLEIPHRVEFFNGGHEWPPPEYCSRALDWMELQAMKRDKRSKDAEWIQQKYVSSLEEAKKLEASSKLFEAYIQYTHLNEDFNGLLEIQEVADKLSQLAASPVVKKGFEERKKREEREQRYLDSFIRTLGGLRNGPEIPSVRTLRADLKISQFQKESKEEGNLPDALVARRLLETIFTQTGFYLPQYFFEKKDYDRAAVSLTVAAEIHPDSPYVWYRMALAHIRKGDKKKTLESLQKAIDRGFNNRKWIDDDPSFDSLREDQEFNQLLSRMNATLVE